MLSVSEWDVRAWWYVMVGWDVRFSRWRRFFEKSVYNGEKHADV